MRLPLRPRTDEAMLWLGIGPAVVEGAGGDLRWVLVSLLVLWLCMTVDGGGWLGPAHAGPSGKSTRRSGVHVSG